MNGSGIGVPHIQPRTSADWQGGQHSPDRQNDGGGQKDPTPNESPQAPPPPGLGLIVDKTV
jgi:hypothetical protein